ncbi:opioid growth factor receptor conserved region-domain-containing protein [Hypoxylon sp. FL0543]|nr:opioid growth factor receptor conserved region-domain-containing protein [Hypoxylon sp. FL0543]
MSAPYSNYDYLPQNPRLRELLLFYHVFGADADRSPRGSFLDILRMSDAELERKHDFIQWLFPLETRSAHVADVPVLDSQTILIFRTHEGDWLRENVKLSLMRMMWFYGFDTTWRDGQLETLEIQGPREKFRRWLRPRNHNHNRISRIIRCLRLLGMWPEARVVHDTFRRANFIWGDGVSDTTLQFWDIAARAPLYDASANHPEWLLEFHENEVWEMEAEVNNRIPRPLHAATPQPYPNTMSERLAFRTPPNERGTRTICIE